MSSFKYEEENIIKDKDLPPDFVSVDGSSVVPRHYMFEVPKWNLKDWDLEVECFAGINEWV